MRRGDIRRVRFGKGTGISQAGTRPAVVLQADALAPLSTVVVAPMSRSAATGRLRPVVRLNGTSLTVMTEQMTAVDAGRVGPRIARLDAEESVEVDAAVRLVLGLR